MNEFRKKVGEILYKVSQNPSHFESDPDYMLETVSKELYDIAKKELEANPEFLYSVTRKAAERAAEEARQEAVQRARKETVNKVCKFIKSEKFQKLLEE